MYIIYAFIIAKTLINVKTTFNIRVTLDQDRFDDTSNDNCQAKLVMTVI